MCVRKSPKPEKAGKKPRIWDLGGTTKDLASLERTKDKPEENDDYVAANTVVIFFLLHPFNIKFIEKFPIFYFIRPKVL